MSAVGILLLLFLPAMGQSQDRARVELVAESGTVTIEADRIARESKDLWVAEGQVVITHQESTIEAGRMTYDSRTGQLSILESFKVKRGDLRLKGADGELNLETQTGILRQVEGSTDRNILVQAETLLKTGPDSYEARNGFLTACQEAVPKWSFTVKKGTIKSGGRARIHHTFFKIKNIPVFYFPFMSIPTEKKERSSGFLLPSTGASDNKGRRLSQSVYLVLGRSTDMIFHEDYYSKRGFGHGFALRTRPNQTSSLELDGYLIKDSLDQGGASLNGRGETRFGNGYRAVADFNFVSNFTFRQVFSDNFFTATRPTESSTLFLTRNQGARSLNVSFSREETFFPEGNVVVQSAPGAQFRLSGHRFRGIPIYLDLDTSAEGLTRRDSLLETSGLTQRLDFFPQIYTSIPLTQGLRLTPRLALRETFYGNSLAEAGDGDSPEEFSEESFSRRYAELTLDLKGWGLSRIYGDASRGGSMKHLIEPTFRYQYRTGIDQFDRLLRFDHMDSITDTNEVEYGLFNRFFVKRQTPHGSQTRELMAFKLVQKHFLDPDFGGAFRAGAVNQFLSFHSLTGFPFGGLRRGYSPVTAVARVTPEPRVNFDVRADYDPDFHRVRNVAVMGFVHSERILLGTAYFVTRELEPGTIQTNQVQGQIALGRLGRGASLSSTLRYDVHSARFLNYRARLNYFWDCCGVSLDFVGFNVGVRQENQIRFSFYLKGIGTIGTIKQPRSVF